MSKMEGVTVGEATAGVFTGGMAVGSLHLRLSRSRLWSLMHASKICWYNEMCALERLRSGTYGKWVFQQRETAAVAVGDSINRR